MVIGLTVFFHPTHENQTVGYTVTSIDNPRMSLNNGKRSPALLFFSYFYRGSDSRHWSFVHASASAGGLHCFGCHTKCTTDLLAQRAAESSTTQPLPTVLQDNSGLLTGESISTSTITTHMISVHNEDKEPVELEQIDDIMEGKTPRPPKDWGDDEPGDKGTKKNVSSDDSTGPIGGPASLH